MSTALVRSGPRAPRTGNEWQRFVPLWLHGRPESTQGTYAPVIDDFAKFVAPRQVFKITPRDLGDLRPGLSLDNVAELIEQVEGSLHR